MTGRRHRASGFAMLYVFLLAAIVAMTLYMEIPRVSFESQRNKEELLISRGEQYKRALKVFVAANKRYPARIEELESFNNHRYLRKRYIDPMTGKSEWRIIHIGPGGVFTDSLTHKPKDPTGRDGDKSTQNFGGGFTDPVLVAGVQQNSAVPRRRDSDMTGLCNPVTTAPGQPTMPGMPPMPGMPGMPGQLPGMPPVPGQPTMPGTPGVPIPPQINPATGMPVTNPCPAGPNTGQPGQPGQTGYGQPGQPAYPGQPGYPAQPGYPGQQPGMPTYPTQPGAIPTGAGGFQQPGMTTNPAAPGLPPGSAGNAQQLIQNLLTQPRGGLTGQPVQPQGQTIGGGIAGFASNADEEGIKIYNERTNYKEWEFIYDYTKDTGVTGQQGANGTPVGTPIGQQPGQTPGQNPAQPNPLQPSPFGQGGFNQPPPPPSPPPVPPPQ